MIPSAPPPVGKQTIVVPGGQIIIACSGDLIANASASLKIDSGYALTVKSHTDPAVDVIFSKDDGSSEYVYKCRAGEPLGGIVEQP